MSFVEPSTAGSDGYDVDGASATGSHCGADGAPGVLRVHAGEGHHRCALLPVDADVGLPEEQPHSDDLDEAKPGDCDGVEEGHLGDDEQGEDDQADADLGDGTAGDYCDIDDGHPSEGGRSTLVPRGSLGYFQGAERHRRKRCSPSFPLIEEHYLEPVKCTPGEAALPPQCSSVFHCTEHGGTQCRHWLIRDPVLGWSDDALRLAANVVVRAAVWMPSQEVYVRSLQHPGPPTYSTAMAARESLRLAMCGRVPGYESSTARSARCSFRGANDWDALSDADLKDAIKYAAQSVRLAKNDLTKGHVALISRGDGQRDQVLLAAKHAVLRKCAIAAASEYRRRGAAALLRKDSSVLHCAGAGAVGRIRRYLELGDTQSHSRAKRLRVYRGLTQMRLLPSRERLRSHTREAFDAIG